MTGNERAFDPGLEAELRALGGMVDFPATPDLATAVRARLAAGPAGLEPTPVARRRLRPARVARPVLLAAAILLVLAAVAAAWVVVRGLVIVPVETLPSLPPATAPPSAGVASPAPGADLGLGQPTSLAEAVERAGFEPLVPAGPLPDGTGLGRPDAVYAGGAGTATRIALAWAARPGLPAAPGSSVGLLVEELQGEVSEPLVRKLIDGGIDARVVTLADGTPAWWFGGGRHVVLYEAPNGRIEEVRGRLAADALVFNRDGLLVRIETAAGLATAVAVADALP